VTTGETPPHRASSTLALRWHRKMSWLSVAYVRLLGTLGQCDDSEITQSM
jgi:hypothetical protein